MNLIDAHAHLDHIEDIGAALNNAAQAGVDDIIAVSINTASCRKNVKIRFEYSEPRIHVAMGMHPSDADLEELDECETLIRGHRSEIKAVGEIGLDFWYKWARKDQAKKDEQRKIFRRLLEVAKDLDLPAVIHTRGAWREAYETAKAVGIEQAEFHWYSGPIDVLKDILGSGYYVSASPSVARSPESRAAISFAPIEQTMIETDSPVFYRTGDNKDEGFQAEPKDVFKTLKAYCALKKIGEEQAAAVLNRNAREFFRLDG